MHTADAKTIHGNAMRYTNLDSHFPTRKIRKLCTQHVCLGKHMLGKTHAIKNQKPKQKLNSYTSSADSSLQLKCTPRCIAKCKPMKLAYAMIHIYKCCTPACMNIKLATTTPTKMKKHSNQATGAYSL